MKQIPHCFIGERDMGPRFIIDGTAPDGSYQGDARKPPYVIFDQQAQRNIAGPFNKRRDAKKMLDRLNTIYGGS